MNALSISAVGMTTASNNFAVSAVRAVQSGSDSINDTVDQIESKASFQANAAVFKSADKMYGSLLDITV